MSGIEVAVGPAVAEYRLYPRYDREAKLVEVGCAVRSGWAYGVNVDGAVIFDLVAGRVLVNVDLLIPRRRWQGRAKLPSWRATRSGVLVFSEASVAQQSFHLLGLRVLTDHDRSCAVLQFGELAMVSEVVALSEQCLGLLAGRCLVGLRIDFGRAWA